MEYGLALIEYCSFWALLLFLEQGKCQVVYHSIFPLDFFFHNLDEQEKKECAWCKCWILYFVFMSMFICLSMYCITKEIKNTT